MRSLLFALFFLALGACATPLELYYKPGADVTRMQTEETKCEVAALRDAPVASQVRQDPGLYVPGYRSCNGAGNCTYYPGFWRPGRVYSVDVNAPLRLRLMDQCMAAKGYQRTQIPQCSQSVAGSIAPAATRTMPALSANSCAIRNEGGSWQIVNVQ